MARKVAEPPMSSLERDFHDALDRLIAQQPRHKDLIALKSRGKLKISPTSVAKEAGHSRTHIGTKKCKFPRVRDRIEELSQRVQSPSDSNDVIKELRRQVAELRDKLHRQQDEMKAHFNARRRLEKDSARYKREYERYKAIYDRSLKEAAADGRKIIQLVPPDLDLPPSA
ncbi:hypothetical protein MHY87_08590 [Microvirga sp. ACRRW]|uniref:hypothetical protein n=1 Tax=Microvirga sp. ACRRW TaxID=2918205 RepID=UPI001EF4EF66|nr:hypothetical protein [Microvirga sp. ACRRW]MCG7392959.1 hypothetical protein [Microvirga sp. ACRRW]